MQVRSPCMCTIPIDHPFYVGEISRIFDIAHVTSLALTEILDIPIPYLPAASSIEGSAR